MTCELGQPETGRRACDVAPFRTTAFLRRDVLFKSPGHLRTHDGPTPLERDASIGYCLSSPAPGGSTAISVTPFATP